MIQLSLKIITFKYCSDYHYQTELFHLSKYVYSVVVNVCVPKVCGIPLEVRKMQ